MAGGSFALFETAIGMCGLAWSADGVVGVQLPEADEAGGAARLARRFPGFVRAAAPPGIVAIAARIAAYLAGAKDDFADIGLALQTVSPFEREVYRIARAIPAGTTITYGALAAQLGDPLQARAVGQALGHNPWPIIVPCHRITGADGRMGGFSAPGGRITKRRLLELEGALAVEGLPLFGGARSAPR